MGNIYLEINDNDYTLYRNGKVEVFKQGKQNEETIKRYEKIVEKFESGYLTTVIDSLHDKSYTDLSDKNKKLLNNMVNGITSETGRALVGLTVLQLAIKAIDPKQSIRLHKGSTKNGKFSWENGISMRSLDKKYITPILREYDILKMNKDGVMMTRSLAENYPYCKLYKAEMRGPFNEWIEIIDAIEDNAMPPEISLYYLLTIMMNRSEKFNKMADEAVKLLNELNDISFDIVYEIVTTFINSTRYSARAFEIGIHSFLQAMSQCNMLNGNLAPISQMRSANKKHKNIGDVEILNNEHIIEAWDAKYDKTNLEEEIKELKEKLENHSEVSVVGFICNKEIELTEETNKNSKVISDLYSVDVRLLSFENWIKYKISNVDEDKLDILGYNWLVALVESFARKRLDIAPIDEPCEEWIRDIINVITCNLNVNEV